MKTLSKLLEISSVSIKTRLTYKMSIWASSVVSIGQILIFYYIWLAVYGENSSLHGISKEQIVTYLILSNLISMQITWGLNMVISDKIVSGQIAIELLRPLDFELYFYMQRLGEFFVSAIIESMPAFVVSIIFLHISLPPSIVNLVGFILSIGLAITIAFLIEYIIGILSFYTTQGWGLQITKGAMISFFSGALVPISFFPNWLMTLTNVLPFKEMLFTPVSIYLGLISGIDVFKALFHQTVWVLILLIISRIFFNISIKRVTVLGG